MRNPEYCKYGFNAVVFRPSQTVMVHAGDVGSLFLAAHHWELAECFSGQVQTGTKFMTPAHDPKPGEIGPIGPPRKIGKKNCDLGIFLVHGKMASDGPKWGQEDFFVLIQTSPTFCAEWI